jgi:hypothetical protein
MRRPLPPASYWPEMDEIGTPVFYTEEVWLEQGASWELSNEEPPAEPTSNEPIATLWLPAPGGHREYFIYAPQRPEPPEPPRRPFGFVKR